MAAGTLLIGAVPAIAQETAPSTQDAAPDSGETAPDADGTAPEGATAPENGTAPEDGGTSEPDTSQDVTVAAAGTAGITLRASSARIDLGERVTFSGRRQPPRGGKTVRLTYKGPGDSRFTTIERTQTAADGTYSFTIQPRRNGVYRAVSPRGSGALRSGRESVQVDARVSLDSARHQLNTRGLVVRGRLRPRGGGRRVVIQNITGKGLERLGSDRTERDGRYRLRVRPAAIGNYNLRATFRGDERNGRDGQRLAHLVTVYRSDHASYYGPGFYGNTTACGQTLRRDTVGVAHKRIRCGKRVKFHYKGRTRRIRVIDRGPYVQGRRWDLTNAARRQLGFPRGVDEIWANR